MIWPIFAGWLSHKALTICCLLAIVVALAVRLILSGFEPHISVIYTLTFARMDSLAIGALVALALQSRIDKRTLSKLSDLLVLSGIGFFLVTLFFNGRVSYHAAIMYTVGYTLLATCFAGLLLKAVMAADGSRFRSVLSHRYLTTVGKYSYAMYIIHLPLMSSFGNFTMAFIGKEFYAQLIYVPAVFMLTFLIATISWRMIEEPALSFARNRALLQPSHR